MFLFLSLAWLLQYSLRNFFPTSHKSLSLSDLSLSLLTLWHGNSASTNNHSNGTNNSVGGGSQFVEAASESSRVFMSDSGQILESPNLKVYSFLELKTATKGFKRDLMVGEGGFGQVYRGWIHAETLAPSVTGSGMTVAVKRLNSESFQGFEEWRVSQQTTLTILFVSSLP